MQSPMCREPGLTCAWGQPPAAVGQVGVPLSTPHRNACCWRTFSSVTCPTPGTLSSQDCRSPQHCRWPGKAPSPALWPLLVPSTEGPCLSLVFNPERGLTPFYSSILTSVKEHDHARQEHVLCLSKLCRVFSLDQTYGEIPRTGGQRLTWAQAGPGGTAT